MKNLFHTDLWRGFYANHAGKLWLGQALILIAIGFSVSSSLPGSKQGPSDSGNGHTDHEQSGKAEVPKIWTCSMHPQIRRDKPGKCPICGMKLVPVASSSAGGMRTITISPAARGLMNIETSPVERRYVTAEIRMVGKIDYDETRLSYITAWVSGRLDRLYVDYTGIEVKKGGHLVYIYSEELYAAQEELIQAIKYRRERPLTTTTRIQPIDLTQSAREKLRLLGLTVDQIKEIEQRGTPSDHITIYSEIGGIVIEKLRQQGDRVRTGDRIYTVADLTQLWVMLDAYESDLQWVRYGQEVEFFTESYPGETFVGRIAFIDPVLNDITRTVKVRVNLPNEDGRLKPEMFVRAVVRSRVAAGGRVLDSSLSGKWISPMHPEIVKDKPGLCDICGMPLVRAETLGYAIAQPGSASKPLVIPTSAALVTGKRAIVYVELPRAEKPTFEGREIVLGPRAGKYYLVRNGLKEGDLVVTNGNFKLDSALQISAKPSMMTPEGGGDQKGEPGHQMALPTQFNSELAQVVDTFDEVTAAIEEADLEKIRTAFDGFGRAVAKVDGKLLIGHAETLWSEISMLLRNDAVVGNGIITMQDADLAYRALKGHIQRVRSDFGLAQENPEEALVKLQVPPGFQSQLARLWQVYQPIGQALADDDLSKAKQSIGRLKGALASIDASSLKGDTAALWQKEQANLVKIVSDFNQATDINTTRSAFALLSDEMIALVQSFGMGDAGPIFELHCPMAFKGRGASWLQNNDKTRNPYLGSAMLKCADRVEKLNVKSP